MNFIPFFKAICAEVVISTSDSGKHISLSNKVAWDGCVQYWLYERKCYLELEAIIRKENVKSVLVLGTPGTGRTLFMMWLMWRTVSTRRAGTDISFRVTIIGESTIFFCTTRNGGTVEEYDSFKHGKPDYYFSDSVDVPYVNFSKILTLLVSSDHEEHVELFHEALSTHASILDGRVEVSHGLILVMPLFSFVESVQLKKREISASHLAVCTLKYDVVGGCARNLMDSGLVGRTDRKLNEFVSSLYDDFFPVDASSVDVREWAISIIVDALVSVTNKEQANLVCRSLFRHCSVHKLYRAAVETIWASPFLAFVAGAIADIRDGELYHLKDILIGAGERYVFEYYHGHRFLRDAVNDNEPYPVIDLSTSEATAIKLSVKRIVLLRTVEDIGKLKIGDCGIPTTTNFPLVDAVVKGATMDKELVNLLINFTVGTKRDESDTLPMLTAMLGPDARSVELFIVSEANLHSFKGSGHDIAQYATTNVRTATKKALSAIFHSQPENTSAFSSGNWELITCSDI